MPANSSFRRSLSRKRTFRFRPQARISRRTPKIDVRSGHGVLTGANKWRPPKPRFLTQADVTQTSRRCEARLVAARGVCTAGRAPGDDAPVLWRHIRYAYPPTSGSSNVAPGRDPFRQDHRYSNACGPFPALHAGCCHRLGARCMRAGHFRLLRPTGYLPQAARNAVVLYGPA